MSLCIVRFELNAPRNPSQAPQSLMLVRPAPGDDRASRDAKLPTIPSQQGADGRVFHSGVGLHSFAAATRHQRAVQADPCEERSLIKNSSTQLTVFPANWRLCHWPCFTGLKRRRFFERFSYRVNLATGLPSRVIIISDSMSSPRRRVRRVRKSGKRPRLIPLRLINLACDRFLAERGLVHRP
jgi:hypothetical protein